MELQRSRETQHQSSRKGEIDACRAVAIIAVIVNFNLNTD